MLRILVIACFAMTLAACGNSDGRNSGGPAPQPRPVGFGQETWDDEGGILDCADVSEPCTEADLPVPAPRPPAATPCPHDCPPCPNPTPAPPEGPLPPEEPPVDVPIPAPADPKTVYFEFDSSELTDDAKDELSELLGQLDGFQSQAYFLVEAHSDPIGDRDYNMDLSRRRGRAVVRFLLEESKRLFREALLPNQFEMIPYGESRPVTRGCSGLPRELEILCRADDRRARIVVSIGNVNRVPQRR